VSEGLSGAWLLAARLNHNNHNKVKKSASCIPSKQFCLKILLAFLKFFVFVICRRDMRSQNKDVFGSGTFL